LLTILFIVVSLVGASYVPVTIFSNTNIFSSGISHHVIDNSAHSMASIVTGYEQLTQSENELSAPLSQFVAQRTPVQLNVAFVASEAASSSVFSLQQTLELSASSVSFPYVSTDQSFAESLPVTAEFRSSCEEATQFIQGFAPSETMTTLVVSSASLECVSSVTSALNQLSIRYLAVFTAQRSSLSVRTTFGHSLPTPTSRGRSLLQVSDAPTAPKVNFDGYGNLGVQYISASILAALLFGLFFVFVIVCVASCFLSVEVPPTFSKHQLAVGKEF